MIPLATTTIAVLRRPFDPDIDPTEVTNVAVPVAEGVRAHISTSRGDESTPDGSQEVVMFRLTCDLTEIRYTDRVQDEQTGAIYEVVWARERQGLGLDHMEGGLRQVAGVSR